MKRLVIKVVLLAAINAAIAIGILWGASARHHYAQWQTDSVLEATPRHASLDLVILGSSRAKLLTRLKPNLDCLERELDASVLGMATPFGGGLTPARLYLANFYRQGNQAQTLFFFLDSFMFFSRAPNEDHKFVTFEPMQAGFLFDLIREGCGHRQIQDYFRSKFTYAWLFQKPAELGVHVRTLTQADLDPAHMLRRAQSLFPEQIRPATFAHYAEIFRVILDLAKAHQTRIVIIFAPTLLSEELGQAEMKALLEACRQPYNLTIWDLSKCITEPGLFADFDHLNTAGVERFTVEFLKPRLKQLRETPADFHAANERE